MDITIASYKQFESFYNAWTLYKWRSEAIFIGKSLGTRYDIEKNDFLAWEWHYKAKSCQKEGRNDIIWECHSATHGMTLIPWPLRVIWHDLTSQSHTPTIGMTY